MKDFLYEYYRIYPDTIIDGYFSLNGYHYLLLVCELQETELGELIQLNNQIAYNVKKDNVFIIKTISNDYLSIYEQQAYILICFKEREIGYDELLEMNNKVKSGSKIDLSAIQALWEKKMDFVEQIYLPSLNLKDTNYERLVAITSFYLGLAENAIEYLVDTIYDFESLGIESYLCHKRINRFNVFELYNPLNYIFDCKARDIGEMIKSNTIDLDTFKILLQHLQLNQKEYHYLMARVLFPSQFFDLIEENYYRKTNINEMILSYYHKIRLEELKVKEVYFTLNAITTLRPIDWLLR